MYPFEKFARNELGLIRGKNKKFYHYCKRLAGKREDIAYWLYELGEVNNDTRKQYIKFAQEYFSENEEFSPIKLKVRYRNMNANSDMSASYLDRQYRAMCQFGKRAYGFETKEFAKIKWVKKGQQIEKTKAAKSADTIKWLHGQLRNDNNKENALIIHLMYALALRANEISFLRFEDIIQQDREYVAQVYRSKTNEKQSIQISKELYDEVMEFKQWKIDNKKYELDSKMTPRNIQLPSGHYIVTIGPRALNDRFRCNFNLDLEGFTIRPKDLRVSAISATNQQSGIASAAKLANHKNIKTTKAHYIRSGNKL